MSKLQLIETCKELGITKCNSKNKAQLIELIQSKQKNICEVKKEVEINIPYNFIEVCAGGGG